jgi:hypothetical protein
MGNIQERVGAVMEHRITFFEKTEEDIRTIIDKFGFVNEEEFVEEAVVEKILELKARIFLSISDQVEKALKSRE